MAAAIRHLFRHLKGERSVDAVALTFYFICVFIFILVFEPGLVVGQLILFIVPGLYLVIRYWRQNYHAFLFSIVAGFATGFPLQIMAELNNVWDFSLPIFDMFSIGGVRLAPLAWYVTWIGLTTSVYSVFFDEHVHPVPKHHRFWRRHYRFILLGLAVLGGSIFVLFQYPGLFVMSHPYIIFGALFFVVPTFIILYLHPHLLRDIAKAAIFLTFMALIYEIIGLRVGWWTYPGEYIGTLSFFNVVIPIEEFVLWVGLGSLWAITAYEEIESE